MKLFQILAIFSAFSMGHTTLAGPATSDPLTDQLHQAASSFGPDVGGAERIASADLLRVYSQEVAAAACYLYNDVDVDVATLLLQEARTGFDKHLAALINGNDALGINGPEERRKTVKQLEDVGGKWVPIANAVDALFANKNDDEAIALIKAQNMPLFEVTNILVSDLEGQYSNPAELLQADVLMLEIVGRQAMMTQKIAKNACKIWSGNTSDEVNEALSQSMQIFELSLNALMNGMPEVSLRPAPTPEIYNQLEDVLKNYGEVKPLLTSLTQGETLSREHLIDLFRHMEKEMHTLEDITNAYVDYSKHIY